MDQVTAAPGNRDSRPPVVESALQPGAAAKPIRATARQRAIITPLPWKTTDPSVTTYPTNHPYVRRYWTATIGPGAVADLPRCALECRGHGTRFDRWLQRQSANVCGYAFPGAVEAVDSVDVNTSGPSNRTSLP